MVGYTYSTYQNALITMLPVSTVSDPNFVAILPSCIDYAEQRCYRELNLLDTIVRDASASLATGSRNFTLPTASGRFEVVQAVNLMLTGSTRQQLVSTSRNFIDFLYPDEAVVAAQPTPLYYAMITDQTIIVGPAPSAIYALEIIGTIRPTPLSVSNATSYLSQYLPDLFFAASMVFMSGYQKNFGSQSDDPAQAVSWETQYKSLFASANTEETRKRYNATLDTAKGPN